MSVSTAIGRVSESLRSLLLGHLVDPQANVTILPPDTTSSFNRRINLFLYKVQQNAFLRNQDWQVNPANTGQLLPPPLSLNLYYLMTAYTPDDATLGNASAHELLGDAMRIFYEFAIVPDAFLAGDLGQAREQIRITHNGLDMEELSQVWSTFNQPFRLSVLYEVSVVQLDPRPAVPRPMPARVRQVGVPGVGAPYQPPRVLGMAPGSGPVGTVVTFTGEGLEGWNAHVRLLDQRLVDGVEITGEAFPATIPNGLAPGFYELRVDVAHLFRSTFLFEVTP